MEYKDYLKTDHWQKLRKEKIKKVKDCEICGTKNTILDVHHKRYKDWRGESYLFREPKGVLKVLCRDCHFLFHNLFGNRNFGSRLHQRIKNLLYLGLDKKLSFLMVANKKYKSTYRKLKIYGKV